MKKHLNLGLYSARSIRALARTSPWIQDVFTRLLFEEIRSAIKPVQSQRPRFNPYLYENLLSDISKALDRCLAYRLECASLEKGAIKAALDNQLFDDLFPISAALNQANTDSSALSDLEAGQTQAAQLLTKGGGALSALAPAYTGAATAAADAITNQQNKKSALDGIQRALKDNQDALQKEYITPGHAMNFKERRDRVVEFIKQDIADAYEKAMAACAGIQAQLNLSATQHPFPVITDDDTKDVLFLDNFVLWTREVIQQYELYTQDEVVFDLVLPTCVPYSSDFASIDKRLLSASAFSAAILDATSSGGLLAVPLKKAIPSDLVTNGNARLRGLGISVTTPAGVSAEADTSATWSAVVFLPPQNSPYSSAARTTRKLAEKWSRTSANQTVVRPPVVLGQVFPYSFGANPAMSVGPEVWNADPSLDNTQILILPMALDRGPARPGVRNNTIVSDVKIHLRLVAKASPRVTDWTQDYPPHSAKRAR